MSYIVWGCWLALFCVIEGLAAFWDGCPWATLSRTVWNLQTLKYVGTAITLLLLFVLSTLQEHLLRRRNVEEGDSNEGEQG
jgi:hypothetical protein